MVITGKVIGVGIGGFDLETRSVLTDLSEEQLEEAYTLIGKQIKITIEKELKPLNDPRDGHRNMQW